MNQLLTTVLTATDGRGLDPNIVRPGWLALGIVALLGVGLALLLFSFSRHAKKASQPWEGDPPADDADVNESPRGQQSTPRD